MWLTGNTHIVIDWLHHDDGIIPPCIDAEVNGCPCAVLPPIQIMSNVVLPIHHELVRWLAQVS